MLGVIRKHRKAAYQLSAEGVGAELYAAQQEYLLALKSQVAAKDSGAPDRADSLVHASRKRLELWGLSQAQLDGIAKRGEPIENLPFQAPTSGRATPVYATAARAEANAIRRPAHSTRSTAVHRDRVSGRPVRCGRSSAAGQYLQALSAM